MGLQRRRVLHLGAVGAASAIASRLARAAPSAQARDEEQPLDVVCSFSILADIARNVAGEAAAVTSLVGPDSDPHVFEPTPAAVRRVAAADVVVVNGLGFEGWLPRLITAAGYRGPVVVASSGVATRRRNGGDDPHIWQDLGRGQQMAANIATALQRRRPALAAAIRQRAAEYAESLAALDRSVRAQMTAIPRQRRRVVTAHDAFGYFGEAYEVDFLAPLAGASESEPSAASVARLTALVRREGLRAVFVENIADRRLLERIAKDAGTVVGGTLYSDALSPLGSAADTYSKLVMHNVTLIASALRGR